MKKLIFTTLLALTVFVSVFSFTAQGECCPWDVVATIVHNGDCYVYRLSDNLSTQSNKERFYQGRATKWKSYEYLQLLPLERDAIYNYILPNFDGILRHFKYLCQKRVDATVTFDKTGFTYRESQDGIFVDKKQLFESLIKCVNGQEIYLPLATDKATTVDQLKHKTQHKATFSTTFANSNANRCHNIALATELVNGTIVDVGENFSFNQIVGKRTEQNGYKNAKVIQDGLYVDGIGGGVCQVSTTLYNALLLADLQPKAYQHSLVSNYVLAGFDAMVSDVGADLTFENNTESAIYIKGQVVGKRLTFTIYGLPNKYRIERETVAQVEPFQTVEIVDKQKYPELIYTDQTLVVTSGSDGVKSQAFLKYFDGDKLVATKRIRQNNYKRVDKIVARGDQERPTDFQ